MILNKTTAAAIISGCIFGLMAGWSSRQLSFTPDAGQRLTTPAANDQLSSPLTEGVAADLPPSPETRKGDNPLVPPEAEVRPEELAYDAVFAQIEAEGFRLVPKKILPYLAGEVVRPDGVLSRQVIELFQLSPAQVEDLNVAIKSTARQLELLESERVQTVFESENEVILRIGALSAEGQKVKENFRDALSTTLGERAGAVLFELMGHPDSYFQGFSDEPLDILFYVVPNDENPSKTAIYFSTQRADPHEEQPEGRMSWKKPLHSKGGPAPTGRHSYLLPWLSPEMQSHFRFHP